MLFDLDNTLFDRDHTFLSWAQWFVRQRLGVQDGREMGTLVDLLVVLHANGYGPKDVLFQRIKDDHPTLAEDVHALRSAFYAQHLDYLSLERDTARLLDHLSSTGTPWGIVTNGSSNQTLKIQKLGLDARTSCIYVSEVVGIRKPAREIFLCAAASLRVEPGKILFVGDHPEADIAGARATGMRTAWLRRGRSWPESLAETPPDLVVNSLADVVAAAPGM